MVVRRAVVSGVAILTGDGHVLRQIHPHGAKRGESVVGATCDQARIVALARPLPDAALEAIAEAVPRRLKLEVRLEIHPELGGCPEVSRQP